jgi:UDP-N-acetylmuramate--alanine ligase
MFNKYRIIHFVGIGGIGMSGIAEVLHNLGYEITGSDIKESETTNRLKDLGIKIFIGHDRKNINDAHVVVISSAVSENNPEVIEAKKRAIPVIPRAEMLAELGRLKYGILVAGAHGKTTTTSLIATILGDGGLDPTVVIGGKLKSMGSNAKLGQGDYIVAEADESDGSFLKLNPTIAVITNIDKEHLDYFKELKNLKAAFLSFINKIPFYGIAVVCLENEHIKDIIPFIKRRFLTYGFTKKADIYANDIQNLGTKMSYEVIYKGSSLGRFDIPIPGRHNVLNSLASIAVSMELQIPLELIRRSLSGFCGIQRRFELKGEQSGIKIFDDYGHHPSEIRATLNAARECFKENRLLVIFQPHRFTRTRDLMDEFAKSFNYIDRLFLMDIYAAGERPIEGISSEHLYYKIKEEGFGNVTYIPDKYRLINAVVSDLKSGDVLITLGAGDVYKIAEEIIERLKNGKRL